MATVAGAESGRMLLRRRRLPLGDLTNLSPATPVLTRLKPTARSKPRSSHRACSSTSSIGSSTVPRCAPPPPPPPLSVAVTKGKDKPTRELQSSTSHLPKIQKISKPKVKTGDLLHVASSTPRKKIRKVTREEHVDPLDQSYGEPLPNVKTGDVLPGASSPPSKRTRKVTKEESPHMDPFDQCSGEPLPLPSQDFIEERRAYFVEIDAFELVEEFVSSGSDLD